MAYKSQSDPGDPYSRVAHLLIPEQGVSHPLYFYRSGSGVGEPGPRVTDQAANGL